MECIQSDPSDGDHSLLLSHNLNRDKQVDKVINNATRQAIEIEINCNDENVNIHCSPGFYNLVVKPCLLSVSKGFQVTCKNITFELVSSTPHKDLSGCIQSCVLKFIYKLDLIEYGVTISLHHTTQLVQIQGGCLMSDGSKAATFILNHFIADLFNSRSLSHKSEIDEFNAALIEQAKKKNESRQNPSVSTSMLCSVCCKDMSRYNSKIVPCVNNNCYAKMHTKCFRKHACPFVGTKQKSTESITATQFPISVSSQQEEVRPYIDPSSSSIGSSITTTSISFSAMIAAPMSTISSQGQQSTPVTFSFSRPALQVTSSVASSLPVSNVNQSVASLQPLSSRSKRARQAPNPEDVQVEFLKKELSIAQTRITALESDVSRKEETCKILEQRIQALEHPVITNMFNKYIPQPSTSSLNCAPGSCPSLPQLDHIATELISLRDAVSTLSNLIKTSQLQAQVTITSDQTHQQAESEIILEAEVEQNVESSPEVADNESAAKEEVPDNDTDDMPPHQTGPLNSKRRSRQPKSRKPTPPHKPYVQPWLSSTVWDNGPTLPLPKVTQEIGTIKKQRSRNHQR